MPLLTWLRPVLLCMPLVLRPSNYLFYPSLHPSLPHPSSKHLFFSSLFLIPSSWSLFIYFPTFSSNRPFVRATHAKLTPVGLEAIAEVIKSHTVLIANRTRVLDNPKLLGLIDLGTRPIPSSYWTSHMHIQINLIIQKS